MEQLVPDNRPWPPGRNDPPKSNWSLLVWLFALSVCVVVLFARGSPR